MKAQVVRAPLSEILERSYRGRRVLITGHNGFVGSWLTYVLSLAGAHVVGYSLSPVEGGIAEALDLDDRCLSIEGDVRDLQALEQVFRAHQPEIVFHLAAQPLVLASFEDPLGTLSTNVMGTANVLESIRRQPSVRSCVVITSDKCYATSPEAHDESDPFGGDDLYSASKGAAEIVIQAYRHSFFGRSAQAVAAARAGNIVGGGDWAEHRIVPDSIRAIQAGEPVRLRHPEAVRPWQHVLDAVAGYLRLGDALTRDGEQFAEGWNFGPDPESAVTVAKLVNALVGEWRSFGGRAEDPIFGTQGNLPEREYLTLLSSKAHRLLCWRPFLDFESTVAWTTEWYFKAVTDQEARTVTELQISRFLEIDAASEMIVR